MKISKICLKQGAWQLPVTTDLQAVVEKMHEKKMLSSASKPRLLFSATFGRGGLSDVRHLTGLLLLTAASDAPTQIREWQQGAGLVPYTLLAFRSQDRRELHVVVRVVRADGQEPAGADDYLAMLQQAQRQASVIYQSLAGCEFRQEEVTLSSGCALSYDPLLVYHPESQMLPVVLNTAGALAQYADCQADRYGYVSNRSEEEEQERLQLEYHTCLQHALEEATDGDEQALAMLAGYCRKARLGEEACVHLTLWQWQFHQSEDLVRKIFRSAYASPYRGKSLSQMNQKERIARTIRDFFSRRYQLRYNMVKQMVEFRPNNQSYHPWRPLDDRELHRIAFEEMQEGGQGWLVDIELYVHSSMVPSYHPIHEFLAACGQWDQKRNYIEEYARRLKTDYAEWPRYFHRWLLAMVAQAMGKSRDYGNSMVPLLIGGQAMKKSTFCKNILPYALRDYYMDDIKMDNAEQVERVLGRMWLVNIDEYNSKTDREQAKIKRLLTEKDVQVRRMRSDQYTMTPRLCSFIATTNERRPLCDPTGSRRYLCVQMTGQADMTGTIDHRQMFAQAVYEIEHGVQYWFDNDDEREISEHNRRFQARSSAEEALATLFEPAENRKEHFMTATEIQQELRRHLMAADVPTLGKLGRALHRQHIPDGSQNGIHGYYLTLRKKKVQL